MSLPFLNSSRVSSHILMYDTYLLPSQKWQHYSREAQIVPSLIECEHERAFKILAKVNNSVLIKNMALRDRQKLDNQNRSTNCQTDRRAGILVNEKK